MTSVTTKQDATQPQSNAASGVFDNWFDPIEAGLRGRIREFIEAMIEGELAEVLARPRYGRQGKSGSGEVDRPSGSSGHRHESRMNVERP